MNQVNSRRTFLGRVSSGLLGAGLAACGGSQANTNSKPAFVLVHGAWHNASTYTEVIAQLAGLGHFGIALDLPGHGVRAKLPSTWQRRPFDATAFANEASPIAGITLTDYASHVIEVIDQVRALGYDRVVLVGHSLGGVTITQVGEQAAEKISKLVYLSAFLPFNGKAMLDTATSPEGAGNQVFGLVIGDPRAIGAQRIDPADPDADYRARVKSALYGDVPDDEVAAMCNLLTPDEPVQPAVTPIVRSASNWGALQRHYIKCLQDNAVTPALAQKMIDVADAEFPQQKTVVHTLNSSHSPFLSNPAGVAQLLSTIALS
ncbi:alpha/beta hydrolase [Burkholderia sp. Ac-20353]|uniref:alpha/beta fold hydrolase n=1 Tax=Burkholderia sp. Ac-20353 TaxID=2703894 RepID=UPI00197CA7C7|nr:alpha/beta hydrolase [Burkholderia sp. Ac-20353]MBN3785534.1 alpha/beta hydrolase [Burkholderia sp. Ac-20353]